MNESETFCLRNLSGIETRFTRDERNDDSILDDEVIYEFEVFPQKVRPLGESDTLSLISLVSSNSFRHRPSQLCISVCRLVQLCTPPCEHQSGDKAMVYFVEFVEAELSQATMEALQRYKFDDKKLDSPTLKIQFVHFPFCLPSNPNDRR
ncbi:RNA-binding protein 2-like isoform X1 [Cucumis melo var. makuwa]|uniref:RNA-binding protein 2-like isoform X1 n=1 Tax=Cucumis melo var. makuwa TaxID=1194695 RepID=A0A5A7T4Y1_CUCMM|nr:RNA-binding protein 2-like isoform X1 [Cucumis melo var. makuwa]